MSTTLFSTPFGDYHLQRYPLSGQAAGRQQSLRAWDAADEYLLQWIHQHSSDNSDNSDNLILNDSFGALSVSLHQRRPYTQGDSILAQLGCRANLAANSIASEQVQLLNSLQMPDRKVQLVIIKIPKSLALLEDQLYRLRQVVTDATQVVGGGMSKHIHNSTLQLFERILGPTKTSLAQKKARLVWCRPQTEKWSGSSPYPSEYRLENTEFTLSNEAAVFSRAGLDIGSRFLLQHLPQTKGAIDIIDLGCGNGVLGLMARAHNPEARVRFYDESFMAIASARKNLSAAPGSGADCEFHVNDCLQGVADNSADLVLNNPPFHQQQVVGDHIAWQMFRDSLRVLRPGGSLYVIGNRHLGYHAKLKRLFGNCRTVASNEKFVVLCASKINRGASKINRGASKINRTPAD